MYLFTHKLQQATAAGKAEGREQGRNEVLRLWHAGWEQRRQEAAAKGEPFNEPPPPPIHENGTGTQR